MAHILEKHKPIFKGLRRSGTHPFINNIRDTDEFRSNKARNVVEPHRGLSIEILLIQEVAKGFDENDVAVRRTLRLSLTSSTLSVRFSSKSILATPLAIEPSDFEP